METQSTSFHPPPTNLIIVPLRALRRVLGQKCKGINKSKEKKEEERERAEEGGARRGEGEGEGEMGR